MIARWINANGEEDWSPTCISCKRTSYEVELTGPEDERICVDCAQEREDFLERVYRDQAPPTQEELQREYEAEVHVEAA